MWYNNTAVSWLAYRSMEEEHDREAKSPAIKKNEPIWNFTLTGDLIRHTLSIIKDQNAIQRFSFSKKRIQMFASITNLNEKRKRINDGEYSEREKIRKR